MRCEGNRPTLTCLDTGRWEHSASTSVVRAGLSSHSILGSKSMMNDPPKSCFKTRRIPPRAALRMFGSKCRNAMRHVVPHVPAATRVHNTRPIRREKRERLRNPGHSLTLEKTRFRRIARLRQFIMGTATGPPPAGDTSDHTLTDAWGVLTAGFLSRTRNEAAACSRFRGLASHSAAASAEANRCL